MLRARTFVDQECNEFLLFHGAKNAALEVCREGVSIQHSTSPGFFGHAMCVTPLGDGGQARLGLRSRDLCRSSGTSHPRAALPSVCKVLLVRRSHRKRRTLALCAGRCR